MQNLTQVSIPEEFIRTTHMSWEFLESGPGLLVYRHQMIFIWLSWVCSLSQTTELLQLTKAFHCIPYFKRVRSKTQHILNLKCVSLFTFWIHLYNWHLFDVKGMYFITEEKLQYAEHLKGVFFIHLVKKKRQIYFAVYTCLQDAIQSI